MGYFLTTIGKIWETSLVAVGSHLTLSLGGILFLGFPAAFWCGAYGYAIATRVGTSIEVAFFVGVALAALLGVVFAFFYTRMSNDSFAVITLASVFALDALIRSWDVLTGGVLGIAGVPRLGVSTMTQLIIFQGIIAILALVAESLLANSAFGRSLRALKENKNALIALGTSANRVGEISIIISAFLAGVAGILTASRVQFLDPSLGGVVMLVQILTIAIIAQSPKTLRLLGITIVVVLLPELLRFFGLPVSILGYMRNLIYGLVLIILIYYVVHKTTFKRYV
jgi:branched-chain amino acid transport system permease protein